MDKLITVMVSIVLLTSFLLINYKDSLFPDAQPQQNMSTELQSSTLINDAGEAQHEGEQQTSATDLAHHSVAQEMEMLPPKLSPDVDETRLWQTQTSVPSTYASLENEPVDRTYLKVNPDVLSAIDTGDEFEFYIPQVNEHFEISADEIEYHSNGDKTIKGQVQDQYGEGYPVTITVGENGSFANISTPKGGFIMESDNQDGWIASTVDIHNLQDFNKPDYVIPSQPEPSIPSPSN
ncbi:hypothetical protein EZV61_14720 [Corallincola luteus]|uniref:Uncharacterized protein n=1 Tax=Corallincola luteus TaxID=1775177 RepID=A0ABY2AHS8_9GAMM|nr:hypothetical protein [Corallincola luteus]TCI02188.1 hypothetical protein EZV61_14720 [Corallincola luteus]